LALGEATTRGDAQLASRAAQALTSAFTTAFLGGAAMMLVALLIVATLVTTPRTERAAAGLDAQSKGKCLTLTPWER
jgi:hypothetical protein